MEVINLIVEESENVRLDKYLANKLPDYTRSFLQKQIEDGKVIVNGKQATSKLKIKSGDEIVVNIPDAVEVDILPENIPLDIVYEDNDVIIVNKPQDMVVHPAPGHYSGTLVNALLYHCKDGLSGINGEIRPGIVHRIDKDTSGLLMIAKNDKAHVGLSELLKDHDITRKYHAIVYGILKEKEGTINKSIGRDPKDRKKMAIVPDGREAITDYKVLEEFKGYSYVELTLHTGRTHQIRVHMKSIGHPLLGDVTYGPAKKQFGITGQMLHAKVIGFKHPITGEEMYFDSQLPDYFTNILNKLRKM